MMIKYLDKVEGIEDRDQRAAGTGSNRILPTYI